MPGKFIAVAFLLAVAAVAAPAQTVKNPRLSPQDLEAAKKQMRDVGGSAAELTYAARLDLVARGSFDSLMVVYALPVGQGHNYFAFVIRDDKRYPVVAGEKGTALPAGDRFLRIGLKHQEGASPILRIMGAFSDPARGELQRNADFQFNGSEFALVGKSEMPVPK